MNLFGSITDKLLNSGAFAGLNSPQQSVDRGIPEGMKPGPRAGGGYMDQATQLSGVHPQPAPPSQDRVSSWLRRDMAPGGIFSGSYDETKAPKGGMFRPNPAQPSPAPQMPLAQIQELLRGGGMGQLGSGVLGQLGSMQAPAPAPQPKPEPQPQPQPQSLPPEFMYGSPFMGLNRFMF